MDTSDKMFAYKAEGKSMIQQKQQSMVKCPYCAEEIPVDSIKSKSAPLKQQGKTMQYISESQSNLKIISSEYQQKSTEVSTDKSVKSHQHDSPDENLTSPLTAK